MSTIKFEQTLQEYQNLEIQLYSSNSLNELDFSIGSTTLIGTLTIELSDPDRLPPSNEFIYLSDIIDNVNTNTIQEYSSTTIENIIEDLSYSIVSTASFGEVTKIIPIIDANSVINTNLFDLPQLNFIIDYPSLISTVEFGGFTQLNMEIDPVPLPPIVSTAIIPEPNVIKVITPLGIASTTNFDIPAFIDNIHRLLVYKDDNISKIGENDATVIAGGIRINPSVFASNTATSGTSDLPTNPVGFLSVNISGIDYKIPYYNS